jgi:hypothetical protein
MVKNIAQRLRRVEQKLAQIDKRLGFIESQLWFQPFWGENRDWQQVPVFKFQASSNPNEFATTEQEVVAQTFVAKIDRDWLDINLDLEGRWAVRRRAGEKRLDCEKVKVEWQDGETFGTITLRPFPGQGVPGAVPGF